MTKPLNAGASSDGLPAGPARHDRDDAIEIGGKDPVTHSVTYG
ncbi:hypothetical protein [Crateriforma spongiae]|nr:hypothetical protein [Crateriforma spongiae]